ncbi:MAG: DUF2520 domain-containing protein [Muribaculaceae bacterium]|nr:DUF2520 domain-containing protein [Muribaculaceae bacterium]
MNSKIVIIGSGNVATHLDKALNDAGHDVTRIPSRTAAYDLSPCDFIIIAVKDDAIAEVARKVAEATARNDSENFRQTIVAHTSGGVGIESLTDALPSDRLCGVFYPLQTFSRDVDMGYSDIPFLIEGISETAAQRLSDLASTVSNDVREADSNVRKDYHIGAVLACNFTNHLCTLADDWLTSRDLDFRVLLPLLHRTLAKLDTTPPADAQTGPAARHDDTVVERHLDRLSTQPATAEIYRVMTDSIRRRHPKV